LRLGSAEPGPLEWVTGLYWFEEVGSNIDLDVLLPAAFGGGRAIHFVQNPAISKSSAVFGQATYAFQPGLRGTLGIRYTRDEKSRQGETRTGPNDTPIGVVGNSANGEWSKPTYRVGLDYDLSPTTMLYGTISTGYKAGGFNDGNSVVGDPNYNPNLYYKPESITAYETGLKGRFLDNTLNVAASLFYYDYNDLQKSAVANNTLVTLNAAKAAVKGFELEGRAATSTNGRLNFAIGLLSAKYTEYIAPNGQDLSGQPLDRAPKATVVLGYTHNFDLGSGARIVAYAGTHYSSSYVLSDTGTQTQAPRFFTQPSETKTDATVTYESADDRWNLQAYVKNIENKRTLAAIFNLNGQNFGTFSEPRTYGIRGTIRF
jgi:iron complex outermembrane receptor protein